LKIIVQLTDAISHRSILRILSSHADQGSGFSDME
jgi:hypothetical protein